MGVDWRIGVLGPVEIHHAGHRIPVQGVARTLLALLTRSAGQVVSVEAIVDGLWASRPPAGAERAVASYVSRLRKALSRAGADVEHPATRAELAEAVHERAVRGGVIHVGVGRRLVVAVHHLRLEDPLHSAPSVAGRGAGHNRPRLLVSARRASVMGTLQK